MTPDPQPLTKQDLREALDAALQPLITRLDALATKQDALAAKQDATDAHLDAAVQTLTTKQEAIIDAFAHNLTDLRHELTQQFEILQTRTERTDINLSGLLIQIARTAKPPPPRPPNKGPSTISTRNSPRSSADCSRRSDTGRYFFAAAELCAWMNPSTLLLSINVAPVSTNAGTGD